MIGNSSGFTLLEMVITVTIMTIVMATATLSFNSMQVKSKIESETRELLNDINNLRISAITQKKSYQFVFQPTSYIMKMYSSSADTTGKTVSTKSLNYSLTNAGSVITNTSVTLNSGGIADNPLTIFVGSATQPAAVNCIAITTLHANIGQINGANCEYR